MPLNRYTVRVDPQGQTVVVDVLDTSGVSVVAYESSQFDAATLTLPLTITTPTDFCLHDPGPYDVSCKVGGAEVADAGAPQRVQVSDVPALVVPDWERQRTAASSGGSSSLPIVQLTSTSGWVIGTSQPSAWADAGSAGGTALTPDAAAGTIAVNENGFYLVLARLSTVVCTAAGYLTLDDTNGRFLVDRSLPISTYGATLSISDLVFQTAGTVMALEVYTGDGALAGHGGNVDLYVTQIAKSAI